MKTWRFPEQKVAGEAAALAAEPWSSPSEDRDPELTVDAALQTVRRLRLMPLLNRLSNAWFWLLKRWSRVRGISDIDAVYTRRYFELRNRKASQAAVLIAESLVEQFAPSSVADLGCGTGIYLRELERRGVGGFGYEGSRNAVENAVVGPDLIALHDLRQPIAAPGSHDVVICIEVAEHLPAKSADQLVDNIASLGDTVLFSAAGPGQGGRDHINEKPPEYWIAHFEKRGYRLDVDATHHLRKKLIGHGASWWLRKNLMVLTRIAKLDSRPSHPPHLRQAAGTAS